VIQITLLCRDDFVSVEKRLDIAEERARTVFARKASHDP
jgi:hypothetical protein